MEYLTTYGWAILIVGIITSLLYLYATTPSTIVPASCIFVTGVHCNAMVIGVNPTTHATTVALFLTNSQPYPLANPYLFVQLNGANSTGIACSPNYALAAGSMVCVLPLSTQTSLGQFLAGKLYLNATYCGLNPNYSGSNLCAGAQRETYAGDFSSHVEPLIGTNTMITLTVQNITQAANNAGDPLIATVKLLGYPLRGATVNFTANVLGYTISPNYTTTNTTGKALSYISGNKAGNVLVTASYAGLNAITVVQFIPAFNVRFNINFPYCASAGQIITIDGIGYTCPQLSSQTFTWASNTVHSCDINNPVIVNSLIRGQCSIVSGGTGSVCTAGSNTTITINCTSQYYLTMAANTGGSVLPTNNWYNSNTVVPISQSANSGFQFNGWTGTGTVSYTGASSSASVTMDSPVSETSTYVTNVVFTESGLAGGTSWSVTLNGNILSSTGASITFNNLVPASYSWSTNTGISCGTGCQYSPSPPSGSISTASGSTAQPLTYAKQYYLTMAPGSNGAISPSSGWYNSGATPTITGTPNSGYSFISWAGTGAGSYNGAANPTTVMMSSAISETGSFAHVITYNPGCGNYPGDAIYSSSVALTCNVVAGNSIMVNNGVIVNENGFYMQANNTFTNAGTVTDAYDSGAGGAASGAGTAGGSRTSKYLGVGLGGGHGGVGGGNGGYGPGTADSNNGAGGSGGNGGGIVEIYSGNIINSGLFDASGKPGVNGNPGTQAVGSSSNGQYQYYWGGGGGGGGGGSGGNGGTVLLAYTTLLTQGTVAVTGGASGSGGSGGVGNPSYWPGTTFSNGGNAGNGGGGGGGGAGASGYCGNSYSGAAGGAGGAGACGGTGGASDGTGCTYGTVARPGHAGCNGSSSSSPGQLITRVWTH